MKITIQHLDQKEHMEATNEKGGKIRLDGSQTIGGIEGGLSPMQLLLAAAGGCSVIDVIGILEKKRQDLKSVRVEVDGDRQKVGTYSEFKTIHMHYILEGDLDPVQVEKSIELSVKKYCSVSKALEKTSEITYSFDIVG